MNVAIVTSGILPVPPVRGGAVENLVKSYLEYNETRNTGVLFTVYSVFDKDACLINLNEYKKTKFVFIKTQTFFSKVKQLFLKYFKHDLYYHHSWEYFASEVSKKINHADFDVVVVENRPGFVFRLQKSSETKIVLHLHNDMLNQNSKNAIEILRSYSKVITVSNYIKERVDTIMSTDKVHVIHNGIDLAKFRDPFYPDVNRKMFHLSDDDFVVVYSGRIESIKGVKELLEAFLLLSDYEKIKLLIVGGGNGNVNEGGFFFEMQELASTMPEKVVFTGFQSYESIPSILNFCDIAVVPSIWEEPLSLTSLEGMAAGLPLIVTRSGGIPEAVDDECAIIVDNDSHLPSSLSNAILSIYNDYDKRLKMSECAIKRSALFSKEKYALAFFEFLEK